MTLFRDCGTSAAKHTPSKDAFIMQLVTTLSLLMELGFFHTINERGEESPNFSGTRFTCVTGTKVQILTQTALHYLESVPINALVPVEGTPLEMKVLIPLHLASLLFLLLLLYAVPIFFFPTPWGQYRFFFLRARRWR